MIGSCMINGVDIAQWDMFILQGSDNDFLSFAERKEPSSISWQEYDGLDVDLSDIYFKAKKVTTRFFIKAHTGDEFLYRLNAFYRLISESGDISLYSREFDRTFRLRYVSCPEYRHQNGMYKNGTKRGEITVEFSMDDPLQLFTDSSNLTPVRLGSLLATQEGGLIISQDDFLMELQEASKRNNTHVRINELDLSEFGIIVTQCYDTVLNLSAVKSPLIYDIERATGLIVSYPTTTTYEAKQIVIDCVMLANSRLEFYHNYEALFNNLSIKEAIKLETFLGEVDCFYNLMQNFEKTKPFADGIRLKFSLVLTCIDAGLIDFLLSAQDNFLITTQDDYFISL